MIWCKGGEGRVHTSGSPQLCFLWTHTFYWSAFERKTDAEDTIHRGPTVPSLFHCSYKVWPRKHGEEAVSICRGRFVTGAGGVTLVCWPAAVNGLPGNKRTTAVSKIDVIMLKKKTKKHFFLFLYSLSSKSIKIKVKMNSLFTTQHNWNVTAA